MYTFYLKKLPVKAIGDCTGLLKNNLCFPIGVVSGGLGNGGGFGKNEYGLFSFKFGKLLFDDCDDKHFPSAGSKYMLLTSLSI